MEFGVVRYQTATLNKILETASGQHVHGVHIHFHEEWCRCGDSQGNEDVASLANLAKVTCPDEPRNILPHMRPPKMFGDQGCCGVETFVSHVVMGCSENCDLTGGGCNNLVSALQVFPPQLVGCDEELSAILQEGGIF